MVPIYKQGESIAVRKRVPIHLVDATDGITAKTGITGTAKISKNYGTPTTSTNAIVEVDATNQPGLYYVELDTTELDTLGWLAVRFKTAATAEYQIVCQIIQDDPYISHTGPGMSGGSLTSVGSVGKEEMIEIAKMVWDVILKDEQTAKDVLLSRSALTADDIPLPANDEVLGAVAGLSEDIKAIPAAADYSLHLDELSKASREILKALTAQDRKAFVERVEKMVAIVLARVEAISDGRDLTDLVSQLGPQLANLEKATEHFSIAAGESLQSLGEQVSSLAESGHLTTTELAAIREDLRKSFKGLLVSLTYAKYKPLLERQRN